MDKFTEGKNITDITVELPMGEYNSVWSGNKMTIYSKNGTENKIETNIYVKGINCIQCVYVSLEGGVYLTGNKYTFTPNDHLANFNERKDDRGKWSWLMDNQKLGVVLVISNDDTYAFMNEDSSAIFQFDQYIGNSDGVKILLEKIGIKYVSA